MRLFVYLFLFILGGFTLVQAQTNNRVSPLDSAILAKDDLKVEIVYSRPYLKGREFGKDIVPFGKLWRTGANEATVFEVNQDVIIEGKPLKAGKYSLYTIPGEEETVVIFNKEWEQWGTKYNENQDALRVNVPTYHASIPTEQFTIDFDDEGSACLTWGKTLFNFHIKKSSMTLN